MTSIRKKKLIFHILLEPGGEADIYARRMAEIFSGARHFLFRIRHDQGVIIEDHHTMYDRKQFKELCSSAETVFIHQCAYSTAGICGYIHDALQQKRVAIVINDYTWIYGTAQYPLVSEMTHAPDSQRTRCLEVFRQATQVIFNSTSAYQTYLRLLKISTIPNSLILNHAPDMDTYPCLSISERETRETLDVCVLDDLQPRHKGGRLFLDIVRSLARERGIFFHIFGSVRSSLPNIICHENYTDNDIFSIVRDMDVFLFTSVCQETYSNTLSVAMCTGKSILYNYPIGVFRERLQHYPRAQSFCSALEASRLLMASTGVSTETDPEYRLIQNVPELAPLLNHGDGLNFRPLEYQHHLFHRRVVFLSVIGSDQFDVLWIEITTTGMIDHLDHVFVVMSGVHFVLPRHHKIRVIYHSREKTIGDIDPLIPRLLKFCRETPFSIQILCMTNSPTSTRNMRTIIREYTDHTRRLQEYDVIRCVNDNHVWWCNSRILLHARAGELSSGRFPPGNKIFDYDVSGQNDGDVVQKVHEKFQKDRPIIYAYVMTDNNIDNLEKFFRGVHESGATEMIDQIYIFLTSLQKIEALKSISLEKRVKTKVVHQFKDWSDSTIIEWFIHHFGLDSEYDLFCIHPGVIHPLLNLWRLCIFLLRKYDAVWFDPTYSTKSFTPGNDWWSSSENIERASILLPTCKKTEEFMSSFIEPQTSINLTNSI